MRALRVILLTALVAGCHFDKLFNSAGGGAASRGGTGPPAATHLLFATQPTNTSAGATISPPVRVAVLDDQGDTVTTFNGRVSIAIKQDGSLLGAHLSGTTDNVAFVNGFATFGNLSIDQPGIFYTLTTWNAPFSNVESASFDVGP